MELKGLRKHLFEQDYFLTKTNFALNRNTSMDYSLIDLFRRNKITARTGSELELVDLKKSMNPFQEVWREYYKQEVSNTLHFNDMVPTSYDHMKVKEVSHLNNYIDSVYF
jgi:hypothetical protein